MEIPFDYEKALLHLKKALELYPNYPPAMAGMAKYYLWRNDLPKSHSLIREAINMDPFNPEYHSGFALILLKEGAYDKCIEEAIEACNSTDPLYCPSNIIAEAYRKKGLPILSPCIETISPIPFPGSASPLCSCRII